MDVGAIEICALEGWRIILPTVRQEGTLFDSINESVRVRFLNRLSFRIRFLLRRARQLLNNIRHTLIIFSFSIKASVGNTRRVSPRHDSNEHGKCQVSAAFRSLTFSAAGCRVVALSESGRIGSDRIGSDPIGPVI